MFVQQMKSFYGALIAELSGRIFIQLIFEGISLQFVESGPFPTGTDQPIDYPDAIILQLEISHGIARCLRIFRLYMWDPIIRSPDDYLLRHPVFGPGQLFVQT